MGKGFLIDTNAIIEYLENKLPNASTQFIDGLDMQLSIISKIELLAWPKATANQLETLEGFLSVSTIFRLSDMVERATIEIKRVNGIKLPDAIIAATAISNNLTLITRNVSDFKKIEKLKWLNPWDIK